MTLNRLVELIAERVGKQFDYPFKREIEDMVVYWRATLLSRMFSKQPSLKRNYIKALSVKLVTINQDECDALSECNCKNILKTEKEIPDTIMVGTSVFDYVGSLAGMKSFDITTFGSEQFFQFNKYTNKKPRFAYVNNFIYVFNEKNEQDLRIEAIFSDPRKLKAFTCPGTSAPCYTDLDDFVVEEKITQQIVDAILRTELALGAPKEKVEIKSDKLV